MIKYMSIKVPHKYFHINKGILNEKFYFLITKGYILHVSMSLNAHKILLIYENPIISV